MAEDRGKPRGRRLITRRRFIMGGATATLGAYGFAKWDRWDLRLERTTVKLPRLPAAFDGFTIAHLTDLHLGKRVPRGFVEEAVELANRAQPDLVALTGDYVTSQIGMIQPCCEVLAGLRAPHGVVAVLGNHDYWTDGEEVARGLQEIAGATVLQNRSVLLERDGDELAVAGVDDAVTEHDDIDRALADVPAEQAVVMLVHYPDVVNQAAARNVDLVLAGHTHGGQVVVPFYGAPVLPTKLGRRFASGLVPVGETQIFISRGVGMAIMSLRLNCPPQVAVLTLRRG